MHRTIVEWDVLSPGRLPRRLRRGWCHAEYISYPAPAYPGLHRRVAFFGISAATDADPVNAMETHGICAAAIGDAERERKIPNDLLTAIARTESGRWDADREAVFAQPWTVTNGPDGRFFRPRPKLLPMSGSCRHAAFGISMSAACRSTCAITLMLFLI